MSKNYEVSDNELEKVTGGVGVAKRTLNYYASGTVVEDRGNKKFIVELEDAKIVSVGVGMNLDPINDVIKVGDTVRVYVFEEAGGKTGKIVEVY